MLILKEVVQINSRLNELFDFDDEKKFSENDLSFIREIFIAERILPMIENTGKIDGKEKILEELSLLIFQLKEYIPALCNLTNMLLLSKNYDSVFYFTTKIFTSHIGTINYQSSGNYNYTERLFDRFIEIVKNCKISIEHYLPFILEIFKPETKKGISQWRAPALEFLKTFTGEDEDYIVDYISLSPRKFEMMDLLCQFNTKKALSLAIDSFEENSEEKNEFIKLFQTHKKDTLFIIDKKLQKASSESLNKLSHILLSWPEEDNDIKSRIEEIFKLSDDKGLRSEISEKAGINEGTSYKSEKQFLIAVRRNMKNPPTEFEDMAFSDFSLKYKSGFEVDSAGYMFLIDLFKDDNNFLNVNKYSSLKNVFDNDSLVTFLNMIFEIVSKRNDITNIKSIQRMLCVLGDENLLNKLLEFLKTLFQEERFNEGKYLACCLMAARKEQVLNLFKILKEEGNEKFLEMLPQLLEKYSEYNSVSVDELEDKLTPTVWTYEQFQIQKKRLFETFLAGRFYQREYFDNFFVKHPLFCLLSQSLVFGEYKNGNLYNAFILKGEEKKFIVNSSIPSNEEKVFIAIIHPLDCDMKFQTIYNYFKNPTFDQFAEVLYDVKDFSKTSFSVNLFSGMLVKITDFVKKLEKFDFKINTEENGTVFNNLVFIFPKLDIICSVEFEKPVEHFAIFENLASVYFYHLNEVKKINGKYVFVKQNALGIGTIPYRYFGYVMTIIMNATKI